MTAPRHAVLPPQAMHAWDHRLGQGMTQTPVERAQQQIRAAMNSGSSYFGFKPELVFFITDKANDPDYNAFKAAGELMPVSLRPRRGSADSSRRAAAAEGLASQVIQEASLSELSSFQLMLK